MGPSSARSTSPTEISSGARDELVAAARAALAGDEAGPPQVLEDLLEEARRDALTLGDVLDLRRRTIAVEGDVEQRAYPVAALVGQLHRSLAVKC